MGYIQGNFKRLPPLCEAQVFSNAKFLYLGYQLSKLFRSTIQPVKGSFILNSRICSYKRERPLSGAFYI